jgi:antitoxin VapB
MALNLKNVEVERLAAEVARLAGETKTEAVRRALLERRERIASRAGAGDRATKLRLFLETQVWPQVPEHEVGRRLTSLEEDEILGYGRA